MKKTARRFIHLLLAFTFLSTAMLAFAGTARADAPVPLSSLVPGTVVNFVGYNWIVLNPATGYMLLQDNYSSQRFAIGYGDGTDGRNVFNPSSSDSIGYYLNNLDPSKFSGAGFYQRIWYSYPDYKSLIIDHTFDIMGADNFGNEQALVSQAVTHVGLLSCGEWRTYSKYFNPGSGILDNPSAPFWTINPWCDLAWSDLCVDAEGSIGPYAFIESMGVRPTLYLNSNALISGGNVTYYLAGSFPIVTGISPVRGSYTGGTEVTISGYNFSGATGVSFGSVAATGFTVNSNNTITATAPAQAAGTVHVTVTSAGGTSKTYPTDQFTYVPLPAVTYVGPASGLVNGGAVVSIGGSSFTYATGVSFGGTAATSFTINSDTWITATSPPHAAGTTDVTVTSPGGTSNANPNDQFEYGLTPAVTSVSPASGHISGGTMVNITGRFFSWATGVSFGGAAAASFTVNSDTSITATSPAHAAGTADVTVTGPGGTSTVVPADQFTYSANDLAGWWKLGEGSGTVAADSSGYGNNGTATNPFDPTGASDPCWSNNYPNSIDRVGCCVDFSDGQSSFTADIPTTKTGNVSLSAWVKWNGTKTSDNFQPIVYNGNSGANGYGLCLDAGTGQLMLLCVNGDRLYTSTLLTANTWQHVAAVMDSSGNWTIYLNGSQVEQGNAVPVTPSDELIIGYTNKWGTPAYFHGLIDNVRIYTTALTESQVQQLAAVYPVVTGVSPAIGLIGGGTTVAITGSGFSGTTGVSFGGTAATSFTINSDTSITANSPAHATGTVDVTVTTALGGTSAAVAADHFIYVQVPAITGVSPSGGPAAGGTVVNITGSSFTGTTGVSFGGTAAPKFTVNSDASITAFSPAHADGTADVTVTGLGGTSAAGHFSYSANALAAWWKLDEGVGTTATDSSGYGYHGALTGPAWSADHPISAGLASASLDFSGGGCRFGSLIPNVLTNNVSISAWVKWNGTTGTDYQPIAYNGDPGANGYGLFLDGSGNLEILCGGLAWLPTTAPLPANTWAHVAAVEDGSGNWTVYLNGSQAATVSATPIAPSSSNNMLIGYIAYATSSPRWFPGLISDVRIYAAALTPSEVQQLAGIAPIVTGVSPTSGPTAGGTTVTVTGSNFSGATGVTFGNTAATGFTVDSGTSITATSPAHAVETVDVKVTTPLGGTSATSANDQFTYTTSLATTGTINGTVKDGSNNPVSAAAVSLTVSGSVYSASTAADGTYSILNVPEGAGYTVTAGKAGYNDGNVTGVNVTANTTTSGVNLTLTAIPTATHTVSVLANPAAGGTVTGGGTYNEWVPVTVTASVYSGYSFINWTENSGQVSASSAYTFIMGTLDRSLTANFATVETAVYSVNVSANPATGGTVSGGGAYPEGATVTVTATPASGYAFANWTENGAPVSASAAYSFTLGTSDRNLAANFIEDSASTYALTITAGSGGSITAGSNGNYAAGSVINIAASAAANYSFNKWTSTGGGTFGNAASASTTFTMPAGTATVTASFAYNGGGGGGNAGGGGGGSSLSAPVKPTPSYTAYWSGTGTTPIPLPISVNPDAKSAIADMGSLAGSIFSANGNASVTVPPIPEVNSYTLSLPVASLSITDGRDTIAFNTEIGSMILPENMLTGTAQTSGNKADISIGRVDKSGLPEAAKTAIGDRPLIQLAVKIDGKQIEWSNPNAPVTISIPYKPTAEELTHPESIVIWYIDGSGRVASVPNGHFDPITGTIIFSTTHFSCYAVNYNKVGFTDVAANAWYGRAVGFIAARGIATGTGSGCYNPEANLTRGEFLVMMMRAYGIEPESASADNFSDAGNAYYTGYLAAAKRSGISAGLGNNMFAPGREITRQETFTMLYNALKSLGRLPQGNSGQSPAAFSDAGQIASWAQEAVSLLIETGTIGGNTGKLSPASTTTRAEMAQVIYNLLSK